MWCAGECVAASGRRFYPSCRRPEMKRERERRGAALLMRTIGTLADECYLARYWREGNAYGRGPNRSLRRPMARNRC